MELIVSSGSIFNSNCDAIVNPVNCVGISGRGLSLDFKLRYPKNFLFYQKACKQGLTFGKLAIYTEEKPYIINFPTKYHWREQSKLPNIKTGLLELKNRIKEYPIISIAIPALGCGLGGLNWDSVLSLIQETFQDSNITLLIFPPQ